MKKQMMMLLAIAAMAGCSKSEVVDTPNGDGNTPIKLKTFVGKSVKATETKTDNLTAFQMTAYTTSAAFPGTASTDEPTPFIASQIVSRTGESSPYSWPYTGPQYWPQGKKVSFFAYAPTTGVTYAAPAAAGWPGFTYTVAAEASQADLVVAQRTSQDATSNNGSVALNFNHALSQILFSAKCANADFTAVVKTIELSGIQNAGTYTFATSATEGTAIEGSWSGVKGAEGYAYLTNGTAAIAKTTSDPIAGTNGALMLMPQTLTGAKLKVVYTVTIGSGDSEQSFDVTKENVELTGTWAPGMKYTYDRTLVSDATAITIVPGVNTWTTGTTTNPSL